MAITAEVMQVFQIMLEQTLDKKLVGLCTKADMLTEVGTLRDQFASSNAVFEARLAVLEEGDRLSSAGSAKRARSTPSPTERSVGSVPSSTDSQAVEVLTKLRISMHGQQRVKRTEVERIFSKVAESAGVLNTYEVKGPAIGFAFTVVFVGVHSAAAARAKQLLGSLRNADGGWVDVFVPSPRDSEADIRAYIGPERTAEQRLRE